MSTLNSDKTLKYVAVRRAILDKIESAEYEVDDLIPSERELMDAHRVSRITVRKAVDSLVQDGCLYRVQGKGTYVSARVAHDLFSLIGCTEDIQSRGMAVTRQVLRASVTSASPSLAGRLSIDPGSSVFHLERVFSADQRALNYTISSLPLDIFPGIQKYDFAEESLYSVIETEYGIKITHARRTLEASLAHKNVAHSLETSPGEPLILFNCVTFGQVPGAHGRTSERIIETFECWYRTDRHKFYINQVR